MLFKIDYINASSSQITGTEYVKTANRQAVEKYLKTKIRETNLKPQITRVVTNKESFIFGTKEKFAFSLSKEIHKKYGLKLKIKPNPGQEYKGLDRNHFQEVIVTHHENGTIYYNLGDVLYHPTPDEAKEIYSDPGNYVPKNDIKEI